MKSILIALLCAAMPTGAVHAQQVPPVADHWRALAQIDSEAAVTLIEDSHPGAQPSVGDADFQAQIAKAKRHLRERVPQVVDYAGYNAVMVGLAADFRDGHIWSRSLTEPLFMGWTGMMLSRQAGAWIVASQIPIGGMPDLVNARLVSCDGIDAETWAKTRIGLFHADASVEAQLASSASWLLLDEGNPFLKRPKTCVFQHAGGASEQVTLFWGQGSTDIIEDAIDKSSAYATIGLGVSPFGSGYWISLGTLHPEAAKLAAEIEQQKQKLRRAPLVVIDLRGNGGGDSSYATKIAEALAGTARVAAAFTQPVCGGDYWRASSGNIQARINRRPLTAGSLDAADLADYDATTRQMQDAAKAGELFAPSLPACASRSQHTVSAAVTKLPPSLMKGKLVIVTDRACFSSCLLAVDTFRKIGALQVGEATDVSTRYMEVRTVILPSGLRNFSTLQKLALGAGNFGPYQPDRIFAGKMDDTTALRKWIANDLVR